MIGYEAKFLLEEKLPRAFAIGKELGIEFRLDRRIVHTAGCLEMPLLPWSFHAMKIFLPHGRLGGYGGRVIQRFFLCSDIRLSTFRSEPMASIYRYQISHDIHIRIFTCIYIGFRALPSSDSLKVDVNTALLVAQRHHVAERFAELTLAAHFEQLEDPNDTKALASRLEAMVVCCFCLDDLLIL